MLKTQNISQKLATGFNLGHTSCWLGIILVGFGYLITTRIQIPIQISVPFHSHLLFYWGSDPSIQQC